MPYIDIDQCPSCGQPHRDLPVIKLNKPQGLATHWGYCPTAVDPVFVAGGTGLDSLVRSQPRPLPTALSFYHRLPEAGGVQS